MWFGILTPGAHPSRRKPTAEATVFAWTPDGRHRIDGPLAAVHGGLRVVRRQFYEEGLAASPPRCFVCLEPCPVPDLEALDEPREPEDPDGDHPDATEGAGPDGGLWVGGRSRPARPEELDATGAALFANVHLAGLDGPAETPLDEEALILFPELSLAFATPLDAVPTALAFVASSELAPPPSVCDACGCSLPGDVRIRDAYEAREGLEPRAGKISRTRRQRGGGHGRRRAA
ncbi:MAG: hypothetical protein H0V81_10125 [Solirubrobacterales bacterium]|nr:hypothetical protein [Solirubrobacterales bacterium]